MSFLYNDVMNSKQLRNFIVWPVLRIIGYYSKSAENLLLGTIAQESGMGRYVRQRNYEVDSISGAFGINQMELFTHDSLYEDFLRYRPKLQEKIINLKSPVLSDTQNLIMNLAYSVAMARIKYLQSPGELPDYDDVEGMAAYWKKFYNAGGKGTEKEFVKNYHRYVTDE